jgi:hypothetical protein
MRASDSERFRMTVRVVRGKATPEEARACHGWARAVLDQPVGPHIRVLGWLWMVFQIWFRMPADRALTAPTELSAAARSPLVRGMAQLAERRVISRYPKQD